MKFGEVDVKELFICSLDELYNLIKIVSRLGSEAVTLTNTKF